MVLNLSAQTDTEYSIASTPYDYRLCHKLLKRDSVPFESLSFPTIMAKRHREVVGVISTWPRKDIVVAGPVYVAVDGNPVFVFINLVKLYEAILDKAGVTGYYFLASDTRLINNIHHMGEDWKHEVVQTNPTWIRRDM